MANDVTPSSPNGFPFPIGFPFTINIPVDQDVNNDYTVDYLFDGNTLKRQQRDSSCDSVHRTLSRHCLSSVGGASYDRWQIKG